MVRFNIRADELRSSAYLVRLLTGDTEFALYLVTGTRLRRYVHGWYSWIPELKRGYIAATAVITYPK